MESEGFPAALVIASRQDVANDNNVLFRMVRTCGSEMQSVNRMVNVVPFRRVYCFERADEIDEFRLEMLRRPLVLQPILHFGRGLGHSCGACYSDEQWVIMVNQTHPKILSRLQMGLDMAKVGIQRGQPVELKFRFGKAIERVYRKHLKQKEVGEASSNYEACLANFRFTEWEHADLTIRYHGYAAKLGRTSFYNLDNLKMNWTFEDIGMHEMVWNQLEGQAFNKPHMAPVSEDDIRVALPSWTINSVSPLEAMGDAVPEHTYSYAQAGRLYESFRKKKRQRQRQEADHHTLMESDRHMSVEGDEQLEGAVGGAPPQYPATEYIVEHNFGGDDQPSHGRRRYEDYEYEDPLYPGRIDYENARDRSRSTNSYGSHHEADWYNRHHDSHYPDSPPNQFNYPPIHVADRPSEVHVDVHTTVPSNSLPSPHSPPGYSSMSQRAYSSHGAANMDDLYVNRLKKQDSDRSSGSTNADSGYHADTDGARSRGGSYDLNDDYGQKSVHSPRHNDKMPLKSIQDSHEGLENPAFRMDSSDADYALQRHKEMVSSMLRDQNDRPKASGQGYPRSPRSVVIRDGPEPVGDTFI